MKHLEPPLYFLFEESYEGNHDFFYDAKNFKELTVLTDNWLKIREEVLGIVTDEELKKIKNLNPPYLSDPNAWKNIYFYNFGWKKHKNCHRFPFTHSLLLKVPNLIFAGITVLEPNSRVLPHNGETNTTIRCHLGLKIPGGLPDCGVQVGNEMQEWKEGEIMMFSDAHYHQTWNLTNERRFVLVFDIIRPEYARHPFRIMSNSLGALTLKFFYSKYPSLKQLPAWHIKAWHKIFSLVWMAYLPLQRRFSFLP